MPPEGRATKARSTPPEAGPEGATRPRALRWLVRGLVLLGALVSTRVDALLYVALVFPLVMLIMNVTSVAVLWFGAGGIEAGTAQIGAGDQFGWDADIHPLHPADQGATVMVVAGFGLAVGDG